MIRPAAALVLGLLVLALASQPAGALANVNSVTLKVYADGTAAISQVVTAGSNDTSISLQLLSAIIASPVVFDQAGSSLYFQVAGTNITIYTVGATGVTLQYATTALTSKQSTVWTLAFTASYNTTVILPQRSTLTSVSGTPNQLTSSNGSPVVVVSPGQWKIDYGVPIQISTSSSSTTSTSLAGLSSSSSSASTSNSASATGSSSSASVGSSSLVVTSSPNQPGSSLGTSTSSTGSSSATLQPLSFVAVATALVAAGALLYLIRRRGSSLDPQNLELRPDDVKVIEFISEKGGKVLEPEIRMRFALPKTSAWRQIKRLERLGYVKVTKIGSQNQIELLKK